MTAAPLFHRVLLKISGESLMGSKEFGLDVKRVQQLAQDIKEAYNLGTQLVLVVGGGNIFRGISGAAQGMDRSTSDYMGMLATVMNSLALGNALENEGVDIRVMSAISMNDVAEPYIRSRALRHLKKSRIVIIAAGTGNPYFTTDTAATLRASELACDIILKGTKVDGVYSCDPLHNKNAEFLQILSYEDVLVKELRVMDMAAIALAREEKIPLLVFSIYSQGELARILQGRGTYSLITDKVLENII
jgi:uridylate kinase